MKPSRPSRPNKSNKKKRKNRKQRTRQHKWNTQPTCDKATRKLTEAIKDLTRMIRLQKFGLPEMAMMAREGGLGNFDKSTYLADTGASTHMLNSDEAMFDCELIDEPVVHDQDFDACNKWFVKPSRPNKSKKKKKKNRKQRTRQHRWNTQPTCDKATRKLTDVTEDISLSLSIVFGTEQVTSGKECYRKIWKDTE